MIFSISSGLLALIGLFGTGTNMAAQPGARPLPVHCTATGAKALAPAMTAAEACARFVQALSGAMRAPVALAAAGGSTSEGLVVELAFLPQGIASARVTRLRAGRAQTLPLYELAVSDRQLAARDIDTLATSVAQGMTIAAAHTGRG